MKAKKTSKAKNYILQFLAIGLFSVVISEVLYKIQINGLGNFGLYAPSFFLSLFVSLYSYYIKKTSLINVILFTIFSVVIYFITGLFWFIGGFSSSLLSEINSLLAVTIYSLLFLSLFHLMIARLHLVTFSTTVILCTTCVMIIESVTEYPIRPLIVAIPTLLAGGIGWALSNHKNTKNVFLIACVLFISTLTHFSIQVNSDLNHQAQQFKQREQLYQKELNSIVPSDSRLQSSSFENKGIDVGIVMSNTYRTQLTPEETQTILTQNLRAHGYDILYPDTGRVSAHSSRGYISYFLTEYAEYTEIKILLNNFTTEPKSNPSLIFMNIEPSK